MGTNSALATRVYEALLYLYPPDFRQAYGDVMICVFDESLSDASAKSGSAGVFRLWLHTLADLAVAAVAEWASRFRISLGIEQRTSLGATIAIHGIVLCSLILMGVRAGGRHPHRSTTSVCGHAEISDARSTPRR